MVVNPKILLKRLRGAFRKYVRKIRTDDKAFRSFRAALKRDFQEDFELAKKMARNNSRAASSIKHNGHRVGPPPVS
jgi:hypothetical protein